MMFYDRMSFVVIAVAGLLLGSIVTKNFNQEVKKGLEEELAKIVMLEVPAMDNSINEYLAGLCEAGTPYRYKYLTAIDLTTGDYGVYQIGLVEGPDGPSTTVDAYAHGHTLATGDAQEGIYKIRETKSHIDVDGVRYWQCVFLDFWGPEGATKTQEELIVSSGGYEIGPLAEKKIGYEGFGNVMIESAAMLSVYDNSEPGIVLLVVRS